MLKLVFYNNFNIPSMAPADWCSYNPNLKCIPIMLKSSPDYPKYKSNGELPVVGSLILHIASGFLNISAGPMNPLIALCMHIIAASVDIPADAPFESDNYLPALIALNGI